MAVIARFMAQMFWWHYYYNIVYTSFVVSSVTRFPYLVYNWSFQTVSYTVFIWKWFIHTSTTGHNYDCMA